MGCICPTSVHTFSREKGEKGKTKSPACSLNPEAGRHWGHQLALNTCSMFSEILIRAFNSSRPPDAEAFLPGRPGHRGSEPLQALSSKKRESCEPANLAIWVQCAGVPGAGRGAHAHGARMDATFVPLSQILQLGNVTKRSYACMHALVHMIERSLGCMGWRRRAS